VVDRKPNAMMIWFQSCDLLHGFYISFIFSIFNHFNVVFLVL